MVCCMNIIYKSIRQTEASSYRKDEKEIKIKEKLEIRFDAMTKSNEYKEETIKFGIDNVDLETKFKQLSPYSPAMLKLDIRNGRYGTYIELLDVIIN